MARDETYNDPVQRLAQLKEDLRKIKLPDTWNRYELEQVIKAYLQRCALTTDISITEQGIQTTVRLYDPNAAVILSSMDLYTLHKE